MAKSVYARFGKTTLTGDGASSRSHVVKAGESLPAIAAYEYNTGYDAELWRQIAEENDVTDLDALEAGLVLRIPPPRAV